jgi:hypothetical protein
VPSTVLGALVEVGEYVEPYFGTNLNDIPKKRFEQCWWYRTEFDLSDTDKRETTLLDFDGINPERFEGHSGGLVSMFPVLSRKVTMLWHCK